MAHGVEWRMPLIRTKLGVLDAHYYSRYYLAGESNFNILTAGK